MEHIHPMSLARALLLATLALPAATLSYAQTTGAESGKSVVTDSTTSSADKALAEHVYSELKADPNHYYRHVTVRAHNGVVTLGGFVWSQVAQDKAKRITEGVPGVSRIVDQIKLEREGERGGADK